MSAKVYFSHNITPETVVAMLSLPGKKLGEKVAVKVHSGEKGNQNFLRPEFWAPAVAAVNGRVVECNTAYPGERNETSKHQKLIEYHGWSRCFDVDLMDSEGPDVVVPVPDGKVIQKDLLGSHAANYDSMLVLAHFKGHPMGGYGGALKQLSIGCASSAGKAYIHSGGFTDDQRLCWKHTAPQDRFLEAMADAAAAVTRYYKGRLLYVNVMKNMSVDCDCCAVAEDPYLKDIGVLVSSDPVAIDRAAIDLVKASSDPGRAHFLERVTSRQGEHTIEAAEALGVGTTDYELVCVD